MSGAWDLHAVTGASALVTLRAFPSFDLVSSSLIPLEGAQPPTDFPGQDLGAAYTLLDPSYLYHRGELKFFTARPELQKTALPAKLADVPGNPALQRRRARVVDFTRAARPARPDHDRRVVRFGRSWVLTGHPFIHHCRQNL